MEILYYLVFVLFVYLISKHFLHKLPPSPFLSLPLIGHLYLFKKPLHRTLAEISNRYGPVVFLRFGTRPVLLVTSPSAAEECFTKNDVIFANRPKLLAGKHLGYNYTTLTWAPYGDHWRNLRKIATLEILSSSRIQMFSTTRRDEICSLIFRLFRGSSEGEFQIVDMKKTFFEVTLNMVMSMVAGKTYYGDKMVDGDEAEKFREIIDESFRLSGATNIGDFIPMLNWVGVDRMLKRLEILLENREPVFQNMIEEHRRSRSDSYLEQRNKTIIDVLLSLQETEPHYYTDEIIKGLIQNMISAGTETSATTMEWALSLLLNNPKVLETACEEINTRIDHSKLINDSDLNDLPYLHGVINETLRMCPPGALIPPHESTEECTIGGFRVPRGTMLLATSGPSKMIPNYGMSPRCSSLKGL